MWHKTDLPVFPAEVGRASDQTMPAWPDDMPSLPIAAVCPIGLLVEGCLLEDRGPYQRKSGYAWRRFERMNASQPTPGMSLWLLDDFGCVVAANWLLRNLWPMTEAPLGLPYLRQMANGVAVEGCLGAVERGALLVNTRGASRDSYALAEAAGYDLLMADTLNVATPGHALATAIQAWLAGRLSRQTWTPSVGNHLEKRAEKRLRREAAVDALIAANASPAGTGSGTAR